MMVKPVSNDRAPRSDTQRERHASHADALQAVLREPGHQRRRKRSSAALAGALERRALAVEVENVL